jgi:hypothetical protein
MDDDRDAHQPASQARTTQRVHRVCAVSRRSPGAPLAASAATPPSSARRPPKPAGAATELPRCLPATFLTRVEYCPYRLSCGSGEHDAPGPRGFPDEQQAPAAEQLFAGLLVAGDWGTPATVVDRELHTTVCAAQPYIHG